MDEISTSFCFICLLHLANEQGLKLEVTERAAVNNLAEGEDDLTAQKRVGEIQGLKVYRDPNASQAA
jgi:condensin complex subunit 2